jgi:magnesium-transporting ATPase (P-type)
MIFTKIKINKKQDEDIINVQKRGFIYNSFIWLSLIIETTIQLILTFLIFYLNWSEWFTLIPLAFQSLLSIYKEFKGIILKREYNKLSIEEPRRQRSSTEKHHRIIYHMILILCITPIILPIVLYYGFNEPIKNLSLVILPWTTIFISLLIEYYLMFLIRKRQLNKKR